MFSRVELARVLRRGVRSFSASLPRDAQHSHSFVVVGGGAGGLALASTLSRTFGKGATAVIEPNEVHYYQPLWTLVGGGLAGFEESARPMASLIPKDSTWFKTKAAQFKPEQNLVMCEDGSELKYDFLIVATGLQLRYDMIKGLTEALHTPGVCSNYSPQTVQDTWKCLQAFQEGNAIFTLPSTPIKCLGAPQKIMYICEDYFKRSGKRNQANIIFNTALDKIFGVKKYADVLTRIVKNRDIQLNFQRNLVEVLPDTREAVFEALDSPEKSRETYKYSLLHVTPPMSAPECLHGSPIADANGFVDVDKVTMQHKKFDNIFALGDCANSPNGKTAAAVAGQSGVVRRNLFALLENKPMPAQYDGYTSCPLVTGKGKLVLAEFDYNGNPLETFPFDQGKERLSMYHLKKDIMPSVYWDGLVRGLWPGVTTLRRVSHLGMKK